MNTKSTPYDLENRLIYFAVSVIDVVEVLPSTKAGNHIGNQLIRCSTSPAPNYGEAQSAESRRDFIHKIKIILKELRETRIWLRIILRKKLLNPHDSVVMTLTECEELIRIFAKSERTAESNAVREKPREANPSTSYIEHSISAISDARQAPPGGENRKISNVEYSMSDFQVRGDCQ